MLLKHYCKPKDLNEAYLVLIEDEKNFILGGGAWLKLTHKELNTAIDLSAIGLNEIIETPSTIEIGAMSSLRQIETSNIIKNYCGGILHDAMHHIMGMNIRNLATIGGSIMGKYSFSDIFTPLLVMDVSLIFHHLGQMPLHDFMAYRGVPKDILTKIIIHKENSKGYFKTVKKTALDFAVLNIAVSKSDNIKIAIGARPGIALRAEKAEAYINNQDITDNVIDEAAKIAQEEIKVSSNSRAGKEYRHKLLNIYVKRGLMEVLHHES